MPEFTPDRRLLERLARLQPARWEGVVWRQLPAVVSPTEPNTRGARWNPPGVLAVYASLTAETARAEALHRHSVQPTRPTKPQRLHEIRVSLLSLLDVRSLELLAELDIEPDLLKSADMSLTQQMGGAAEWLGHDGLIVPSARHAGSNLVIYVAKMSPNGELTVTRSRPVEDEP